METEIKLLLPAASRPIVEAHPALVAVESREARNVSTYFDTPDFALRQRGVVLRIRTSGDSHIQTVKWRDDAADFASRCEAEWTVASETIDRDALVRDGDVWPHLAADIERLAPVFSTDITRTTRLLTLEGKTVVEAVIDEGEARAGDRREPIRELELELKGGPLAPMLRLALDLARRGGLRIGPDAKSERGYALLTDAPPPRPAAQALREGETLGDAVPSLIASACRDFAADLSTAARGDVEGVHRMRAAIRRLRTLMVLFAPYLEPHATAVFNGQLRDLGRVLGEGRDWDVFLTETLAEAEEALPVDLIASLRKAVEGRDREAHAAVAQAIAGPLPTELLLGLSLWALDRHWIRSDAEARHAERPLRAALPKLLDRLERKAMRRGRHLGGLAAEQLHDLRKALKKLRYACQDVAGQFKPRAVARYLDRLKGVLGELGRINDQAVTETLLGTVTSDGQPGLDAAVAEMRLWNQGRRRHSERQLRRRWRALRHSDPFWS